MSNRCLIGVLFAVLLGCSACKSKGTAVVAGTPRVTPAKRSDPGPSLTPVTGHAKVAKLAAVEGTAISRWSDRDHTYVKVKLPVEMPYFAWHLEVKGTAHAFAVASKLSSLHVRMVGNQLPESLELVWHSK